MLGSDMEQVGIELDGQDSMELWREAERITLPSGGTRGGEEEETVDEARERMTEEELQEDMAWEEDQG